MGILALGIWDIFRVLFQSTQIDFSKNCQEIFALIFLFFIFNYMNKVFLYGFG